MNIGALSWRDITHPFAGGSEINFHEQAKRWVAAGHTVSQFAGAYPGCQSEETVDGIRIIRRGGRFTVYAWAPLILWRYFRNAQVVLDIQNGIPFFSPLFRRRPIVGQIHHISGQQFFHEFSFPLNVIGFAIERWIAPWCYRHVPMIAVSETTRALMDRLGYASKHVTVIYNGVDHQRLFPSAQKSDQPTVLYLGRLKRYKRMDLLLEIFQDVHRARPEVCFQIVGSGDDEDRIKHEVSQSDLAGVVTFYGFVDQEEKARHFSAAWVLATASLVEGWGLVAVEAAACGTPAVSFDVPGLNQAIRQGETGFFVKTKEEFVSAILRIVDDPSLREQLSQKAIAWSQHFHWDQTAHQTFQLFERVIFPSR
ncbi:MAG: glycosyltransferase family 4 protein [Patescibacteria group bacterium]